MSPSIPEVSINVLDIHVTSLIIRQQNRELLRDKRESCTMELNILITSVRFRQHNREMVKKHKEAIHEGVMYTYNQCE